jgi:hypothetical protein
LLEYFGVFAAAPTPLFLNSTDTISIT